MAHNIIERKNTIPILANVLLEIKNNIITIVADLDIVFHDQISDLKIDSEVATTTSATVLYIIEKITYKFRCYFCVRN